MCLYVCLFTTAVTHRLEHWKLTHSSFVHTMVLAPNRVEVIDGIDADRCIRLPIHFAAMNALFSSICQHILRNNTEGPKKAK